MKELNQMLIQLASLTGQATSKEQAIEMGKDRYLYLEYSKHYGGYRVVNVNISNGGHSGALGESASVNRKSNREMKYFLEGYINALQS